MPDFAEKPKPTPTPTPKPKAKPPSDGEGILTSGCLLMLVLLADAGAALVVAIALTARGLGRRAAAAGPTATSVPPMDWGPVVGFGALTLAVAATAVVLLRIGHQIIGTVQLTLAALLAVHTLGYWP